MLTVSFKQLNADHGFSLQMVPPPDMSRFDVDLSAVERSHMQYLGVGNLMNLARPEFTEKLVRALLARVRSIFETALGEVELWNKSSSAQLDAQLRERRRAFSRRVDAIQRIQDAAGGLDMRIDELREQETQLSGLQARMGELMADLRKSAAQIRVQQSTTSEALATAE